ncbi:MAG: DUF262 domain-containing protein [Bacteroides sp.]|nr:DUF262 domain-containing protein [Bacteroides sp.]
MKSTTFKQLLAKDNDFGIKSILIPKIQRAYAQGRTDFQVSKTRNRFLSSIHKNITQNKSLTLDFIYGHVEDNCLIPLDGQQRLTTLWLLHWYAAKKGDIETDILCRFSYDTRYSARDFMKRLSSYTPKWQGKLSDEIRNEGWYPLDWSNDPTVRGMFVMLDAIDELFSAVDNLWEKLDLIDFYFLPLKELNLTDEIYIKMNSRGKPLTNFEHFKAEFLKELRNINDDKNSENGEIIAKRIGKKLDLEWTDLLWDYRDDSNLIDDEFLRAIRIVCHIITYQDDRSFNDKISKLDDFQLIKEFFSGEPALRNIHYLESFFDSWVKLNKSFPKGNFNTGIEAFFNEYLSSEHTEGHSVPLGNEIDLFKSGLKTYPNFRNPNVLQWLTTFFTFLTYIQNTDKISDLDFRRRLRIIINLQSNSDNEIVDTPGGDAGNRMPAIFQQIQEILFEGKVNKNVTINEKERPTFNVAQLKEEAEKLIFTNEHPEHAEGLFKLEDHDLLEGRTAVVGYKNTHLYQKFDDLFKNCSRDAIDCAMLSVTDYSQRQNQIIRLGSGNEENIGYTAWYDLFHPSEKVKNFESTSKALQSILERFDTFNDDILYAFAEEYEQECISKGLFDWRYYYIRYPESFRAHRYGRYTMPEDEPYKMVAINAPKYESNKAFQCFLKALHDIKYQGNEIDEVRWLSYKEGWLYCENDRFQYYDKNVENIISELEIPQENGIDKVDRITYFLENPL